MQWQIPEKIIGHRGASAYAPENTLLAFDRALALGCHFLEFDVMVSADGEPFIFHDDHLKRTTNGQGEFGLVTAEYLSSLDAGAWFSRKFRGEKIPHFRQALEWLDENNVQANIEIKPYPGTTEQTTVAVLSHINRYWPSNKPLPLISSFDLAALQLCRNLAPEMPLGLLLDKWDEHWLQKARELQCFSVHYNKRALTAERVASIKAQGFNLLVYTVNRKRQAKKLFEWGVDAIFSDYPDLLA
ncbi:glycerophosphodiester phosphodiesterase [Legionella jordanis]|uniref:Glycerophosphodiester phosphodiesterase, cytosolic n=1 Tax=Legionella jordanis TaxID=456 RepID=A0A0W0VG02_9GAMM|nr:glycerophosphodiester phosphodiesterase [Legionella jordanis]KTD19018.1 glycerophosphodiester phosphodiesterase, cytosolic [Legionella jordanis]RMX05423.1 glycerophosphodiester phosphodiesterase [Legionella jordanis]RMX19105.1 glycerophosphodiester phosphodiesterase [Legionella jordanis]VEH13120.1 glycerophosphodiester phosphodiesterase, cytosolic [Legionella jordanis]HAT8714780.1 glycerophosphodiester phosphodiesterase [Legionella jordanis]